MAQPIASPQPSPTVARRRWLIAGCTLCAGWLVPATRGAWAAAYGATIAAMRAARERETIATTNYVAFGRKAGEEGYRGIAYLFTAFAASESVHASNFEKILVRLNAEVTPIPKPAARVGSTRENLMAAVDDEIGSIDDFYPKLLAQLQPEGYEDAIKSVRYAWASEQQHRDKIRQIQRWTGVMFERVAKTIDEKTGQYFVCQVCGSTLNAIPVDRCPICTSAPAHYRRIEPPA